MLRKGDIVSVEARVRYDVGPDDVGVDLEPVGSYSNFRCDLDKVKLVRPEFRVGDTVKTPVGDHVEVRAVEDGWVWVRSNHGEHLTYGADALDRIDEKENTNGTD